MHTQLKSQLFCRLIFLITINKVVHTHTKTAVELLAELLVKCGPVFHHLSRVIALAIGVAEGFNAFIYTPGIGAESSPSLITPGRLIGDWAPVVAIRGAWVCGCVGVWVCGCVRL